MRLLAHPRAQAGRPFLGICLGLQLLYEGSEESGGVAGLGLIPGTVARLPPGERVPNIGWAGFAPRPGTALLSGFEAERFYYVHSFAARPCDGWTAALGQAGAPFAAAVARGDVAAVQFHPEKSGAAGLRLLGRFLEGTAEGAKPHGKPPAPPLPLSRRVIACLDVRADDAGRLVVTKARAMAVGERERWGGVCVCSSLVPPALPTALSGVWLRRARQGQRRGGERGRPGAAGRAARRPRLRLAPPLGPPLTPPPTAQLRGRRRGRGDLSEHHRLPGGAAGGRAHAGAAARCQARALVAIARLPTLSTSPTPRTRTRTLPLPFPPGGAARPCSCR